MSFEISRSFSLPGGDDGDVLRRDSGVWTPSDRIEVRGVATTPISGRYHSVDGYDEGVETPLSTRVYAQPWHISEPWEADRIGVRVTSAGDGSAVIELALAEWNGGDPSGAALIQNFGTVDATTTGIKEITISPTLSRDPGSFWVLTLVRDESASIPSLRSSSSVRQHSGASIISVLTSRGAIVSVSGQTEIADPTPTITTNIDSGPSVVLRFV